MDLSLNAEIPPRLVLRRSREGIRGGVRPWPSYGRARCRSMRMRRPAVTVVPASGVPVVRRADDVLVGVRRHVRGAGRCWKIFVPRVRCPVPGESCAAARVRRWPGGWMRLGRSGWCSPRWPPARAGCGRRRRGGGALYDGAGLGPPVRGARRGAGGGFRGAGRRAGRGGGPPRPTRAVALRRSARRSVRPPACRDGRSGRVAVRLGGDRREADRRQHNLALPDRRQRRFMPPVPP